MGVAFERGGGCFQRGLLSTGGLPLRAFRCLSVLCFGNGAASGAFNLLTLVLSMALAAFVILSDLDIWSGLEILEKNPGLLRECSLEYSDFCFIYVSIYGMVFGELKGIFEEML